MRKEDKKNRADKNELAKMYLCLLKNYREAEDPYTQKHIKWVISNSFGNVNINPIKVSKEANDIANKRFEEAGIEKRDYLIDIPYEGQLKPINKGGLGEENRGKDKVFHWEHAYTRAMFVEELCKLKIDATKEDVIKLLDKQQIIWVTADENKRLSVKNKSKRDEGWRSAYEDVGITVLD